MSRPLYARVLRLRYLAPSGVLCFVFLEGAVALGILLALAELVSWWGVLVLPVAVAMMVKLNDAVTGALIRPVRDAPPVGRFTAAPAVPTQRPPGVSRLAMAQHAGPDLPVEWPGAQRHDVRQAEFWQADVWQPDAQPGAVTPGAVTPAAVTPGVTEELPGYDDVSPGPGRTVEPTRPDRRSGATMPAVAEAEVNAINGSPSARQWMDQIDTRQRHRQSANRRYE